MTESDKVESDDDTEPGDAEWDNELDNDFSSGEDAPAEDEPDVDVETDDGPEDDECIPGGDQETVSENDGPEAVDSDGNQEENPDEPDGSSDVETQDDPEDADESGEEEVSPGGDAEDEPEPDDTPEESPEEDLLTGMDDLLEECEKETRSFSQKAPEKPAPEYSREEVEEAARAGMMKSRLVVRDLPPDPKRREHYERILKPLAHKAAEEVRKILEGRHSTVRRNLRKGALDPSSLWKVPVRDPDLFMKRDLPGQKADLAVYLLIDCSGSMRSKTEGRWPECENRMDYAAYAAMILHLMCSELNISHAATGFTTQYIGPCKEDILHLTVKKFSERVGRFEGMFSGEFRGMMMHNNVDGYSIRAAAKELSVRLEKQKVLFVISDGYPEAYMYDGPPAFKDTAVAVRDVERSGIRVIGIYIGKSDSTVKLLYPNLIMMSAGDLPVVLARTLKKVITGPA